MKGELLKKEKMGKVKGSLERVLNEPRKGQEIHRREEKGRGATVERAEQFIYTGNASVYSYHRTSPETSKRNSLSPHSPPQR